MKSRSVLLIAFHFPPQGGSSGHLRTLKFCRYLPSHGWQPAVLTAHPRAYEHLDNTQMSEIPAGVKVARAFALDTRRHLSLRGKYWRPLALPDRWIWWSLGAVPAALVLVRRMRIDAILSTFPIATAVLVGWIASALSRKPWIVDLRDSMTEDNYPADPRTRAIYRWLERRVVDCASRILFTAPSAAAMYLKRYVRLTEDRCVLIPNGFDERDFGGIECAAGAARSPQDPLILLHSGLLYPKERDPLPFFRALSRLKKEQRAGAGRLQVLLRAPGSMEHYARVIDSLDLADMVRLLPPVPYREALREAAGADALLLFQAASCDHQIPAKAYEYLRLRKPILALISSTGDTAALLRQCGGATIADIADEAAIHEAMIPFLGSVENGTCALPEPSAVRRYNRHTQAGLLADVLNDVTGAKTQAS